MKKLYILLLLFIPIIAAANDGMFMAEGGQLIPVKETSIEMQKEILYLKYTPNGMEVSVYFEFYNPGDARDEIVGFVTPPASEDFMMSEEEREKIRTTKPEKHPYIDDFMVMVNDKLLPYEVNFVRESGFKNDYFDTRGGGDYIYYFDVHFEPGLNVILHHYIFNGLKGLNDNRFTYRLTTGVMWAKGVIGDFTLIIDAPNEVMHIYNPKHNNQSFLPWQIQGLGRFETSGESITNVFLKSGIIISNVKDFSPEGDLFIDFDMPHHYFRRIITETGLLESGIILDFSYFDPVKNKDGFQMSFESLSDEEIQLLINFLYSRKGYDFKTQSIKSLFQKCIWYIPDPNLKMENIEFTEREQALLDLLYAERDKRKE